MILARAADRLGFPARAGRRLAYATTLLACGCSSELEGPDPNAARVPFDVVEATIPQLQQAMRDGRTTSRELVERYLIRIATYENALNATLAVNPNALEIAAALDAERAAGRVRGPLHGIPIALKDNIHTTDMPTTGGALAFEGLIPPYEATLTTNLREAGAVIIAKTVLTELANWVAGDPYDMPDNYNALGGYSVQSRTTRAATRDSGHR